MAATPRFGFRTRVFFHDFAIKDFAVSVTGPHCLKLSPFAGGGVSALSHQDHTYKSLNWSKVIACKHICLWAHHGLPIKPDLGPLCVTKRTSTAAKRGSTNRARLFRSHQVLMRRVGRKFVNCGVERSEAARPLACNLSPQRSRSGAIATRLLRAFRNPLRGQHA